MQIQQLQPVILTDLHQIPVHQEVIQQSQVALQVREMKLKLLNHLIFQVLAAAVQEPMQLQHLPVREVLLNRQILTELITTIRQAVKEVRAAVQAAAEVLLHLLKAKEAAVPHHDQALNHLHRAAHQAVHQAVKEVQAAVQEVLHQAAAEVRVQVRVQVPVVVERGNYEKFDCYNFVFISF